METYPFSLNPVHFFALSCDCHHFPANDANAPAMTTHALSSTESLTGEEMFAKFAIGWSQEGIAIHALVNHPLSRTFYPEIEKGDSLELFIDTRDLKTTGFNTRFCHHFFFLPKSCEGVEKGEKTRFRTEDSHPLCDPQALICLTSPKKYDYSMKIFIPSRCLYGYEPTQFNRLGFSYRLNRFHGEPQHFSVIGPDYQIDQQPSLWGSLKLVT